MYAQHKKMEKGQNNKTKKEIFPEKRGSGQLSGLTGDISWALDA